MNSVQGRMRVSPSNKIAARCEIRDNRLLVYLGLQQVGTNSSSACSTSYGIIQPGMFFAKAVVQHHFSKIAFFSTKVVCSLLYSCLLLGRPGGRDLSHVPTWLDSSWKLSTACPHKHAYRLRWPRHFGD